MGKLSNLFSPSRVAVIGATEREGSVGRVVTQNILSDFEGEVVAVNPNRDEVLGLPTYTDVGSAPGEIDLGVVIVPAPVVLEVLEEMGEAGVTNAVVITAGFSEAGDEGKAREERLKEIADEYGISLVGPNCIGIVDTESGLNTTFTQVRYSKGTTSFLSQSGALIGAVLEWAPSHNMGFNQVVSLGNKAVLDETDFIEDWSDDPDTDVVMAYLESIEDGRRFIEKTRQAVTDTPVVALKAGRSEKGSRAASSHTGALAGSDEAYDAAFRQSGVIRAETLLELFDYSDTLADQPVPEKDGLAVVTNGGGPGVIATDAVSDSVVSFADLSHETVDYLEDRLPDSAVVENPLDIIGDADVDRLSDSLDAVLGDPDVGGALVIVTPNGVLDYGEAVDPIEEIQRRHSKPVVTCMMGSDDETSQRLSQANLPDFFDPERAVGSYEALERYRRIRQRSREERQVTEFDVDDERARGIIREAVEEGRNRLGVESMEILDAYGIPTPDGTVVETADEADEAARSIGSEILVLKIVSPDISHKTDVGGVRTRVSPDDVGDVFSEMVEEVRDRRPEAEIDGVLVQESVDVSKGEEVIVGARSDPQFGHLLVFGLGGVFVEVFEDVSFRVPPVTRREAEEMTREIRSAPLLRGARGRDPLDTDGVTEVIQRMSQMVTEIDAIEEVETNPVFVGAGGVQKSSISDSEDVSRRLMDVVALDFRMTVADDEGGYE
ncbi:MAG: acetate--CoA ligase family protein [Halobacteria archaeon]|nr:acetate--CoA ligase family protein [Halobacteria archaeon]